LGQPQIDDFASKKLPIDLLGLCECGDKNKAKLMAAGVGNTMALLSVYIYECGEDRDAFTAWLLRNGIGETPPNTEGRRNEKYAALIHAWANQHQTTIAAVKAAFRALN